MASKITRYGTLRELLVLKLNSLLYIEQELVKALPRMAKASYNKDLAQAFADHAVETKNHVTRIEQALQSMEEKPKKVTVDAIDGLIADAEWVIKNVKEPATRDAALIAAAQYVEHYEVSGYGAAREWAALMDLTEVADLLRETLAEEENADSDLNDLALGGINEEANILED